MIVYATRYALTRGIEKLDIPDSAFGVSYLGYHGSVYPRSSVFQDLNEAIKRAEEMREKKIARLRDLQIMVVDG